MMPYQYQPYIPNWQGQLTANMQQSVVPQMPTVQPYQQPVNGIVKVNGPQSAMQIQLPPNSTSQPLIDAGFDGVKGMMYVVSTDGTGTKSLQWFDFTLHENDKPVVVDGVEFASKKELDELAAKVGVIMEVIHGPNTAVPTAGTADADAGANVAAPLHATGGHVGSGVQPSAI